MKKYDTLPYSRLGTFDLSCTSLTVSRADIGDTEGIGSSINEGGTA